MSDSFQVWPQAEQQAQNYCRATGFPTPRWHSCFPVSICIDFYSSADATTKYCYRITWFSDSILDKPVSSLSIISWSWLNFGFSFLCLLWQSIKPFVHLEKLIFKISSLFCLNLVPPGFNSGCVNFGFRLRDDSPIEHNQNFIRK